MAGEKVSKQVGAGITAEKASALATAAALAGGVKRYCPYYIKVMIETKNVPRNIFELAKALGGWESEGGATESPQGSVQDTPPPVGEERILRCLGAAVILQWNDLPTDIQRTLFEDAASMSDPARRFRLKQQMARFLHDHKDDAE